LEYKTAIKEYIIPTALKQALVNTIINGEDSETTSDLLLSNLVKPDKINDADDAIDFSYVTGTILFQMTTWTSELRREYEPKDADRNTIFVFRYKISMNMLMLIMVLLKKCGMGPRFRWALYQSDRADIQNFILLQDDISTRVQRVLSPENNFKWFNRWQPNPPH
jgi:hypothetical protein